MAGYYILLYYITTLYNEYESIMVEYINYFKDANE